MSKKKTKIGRFFAKIGKGDLLNRVLGVGGELITGDITGAIQKLVSKGEITESEGNIALEMYELDLQDVKDARANETARDVSEHSSWLSKNIHELIAIFLTLGWLMFKWMKPDIDVSDVEKAVMLVLAYLFGKPNKQ